MRDFTCCGKILPNLHDLLQHYEEAHTQPSPNAAKNPAFGQFGQMGGSQNPSSRTTPTPGPGIPQAPGGPNQQLGQIGLDGVQMGALSNNMSDEMDAVADMEMDDAIGTMEMDDSSKMQQTRQVFGQQQRPQMSMNHSTFIKIRGTVSLTYPSAANFGIQNNPTVSSVNTPTLTTQQQQQLSQGGQQDMDDAEMDEDFPGMPMGGGNAGDMGDGNFNGDSNFCIDDPGKHLFSPNGTFTQGNRTIQAQLAQLGLTQGQFADPETNKVLLQRLQTMMMPEEHKPFKCPVIGCEKAYKNQNGLKYVLVFSTSSIW